VVTNLNMDFSERAVLNVAILTSTPVHFPVLNIECWNARVPKVGAQQPLYASPLFWEEMGTNHTMRKLRRIQMLSGAPSEGDTTESAP